MYKSVVSQTSNNIFQILPYLSLILLKEFLSSELLNTPPPFPNDTSIVHISTLYHEWSLWYMNNKVTKNFQHALKMKYFATYENKQRITHVYGFACVYEREHRCGSTQ